MKTGLKVLIITEGGSGIGFGHIMRCISIREAFAARGIDAGLIVNGDRAVRGLCEGIGNCRIFDWLRDQERLFACVRGTDIAVIDSYLAQSALYKRLSGAVKTCVYIDDFNRIGYPCGVIVNAAVSVENLRYRVSKKKTYLLGASFAPVRKAYWESGEKKIRRFLSSVLVTFGGTDPRHMTVLALKILTKCCPGIAKNIVVGKGFTDKRSLRSLADSRTIMVHNPSAGRMKRMMERSDIALSGGGQTLYELAATGVPTIGIEVADNQRNNLAGFVRYGFVRYVGRWNDRSLVESLKKALRDLRGMGIRKKMSEAGRKLVDGCGAGRIAKSCIEDHFEKVVIIRKARPQDMRGVFDLSNDPEVRRRSFYPARIAFSCHADWFRRTIADKDVTFLVATDGERLIGQVRFTREGTRAIVSISVAKAYRRLGAGKAIMRKAIRQLAGMRPSVKSVTAYTKKDNTPSRRFFEALGFKETGMARVGRHDAVAYVLDLKKYGAGDMVKA